jgi:hypothetical protein
MNSREVEGTVILMLLPRREEIISIEGEEVGAGFRVESSGMGGISSRLVVVML